MTTRTKGLLFIALFLIGLHSPLYARPVFQITANRIRVSVPENGSTNINFTVRNISGRTLTIDNVLTKTYVEGALNASITQNNCFIRLSNNESCTVTTRLSGLHDNTTIPFELITCSFNGTLCSGMKPKVSVSVGNSGPTPPQNTTIALTAGSPFTLQRDLVGANGSTTTFTITNTGANNATNITANFAGTALNGEVTETANTCQNLAPAAQCTLTFQGGGNNVAETNFPIAGDNTNTVTGALRVATLMLYVANRGAGAGSVSVCPVNINGTLANCIDSNNTGQAYGNDEHDIAINQAGTFALVLEKNVAGANILACPINPANGEFTVGAASCQNAGGIFISANTIRLNAADNIATISEGGAGQQMTRCTINPVDFTFNVCNIDLVGTFANPWGFVFTDNEARAIISNAATGRLHNCDRNVVTGEISGCGPAIGAFAASAFVAINPAQTRFYMTQLFANDVVRCDLEPNGTVTNLSCANTTQASATYFGLAVNPDGTALYISDTGNTIFRCAITDPNTGALGPCVDLAVGGFGVDAPAGMQFAFVG